MEISQSAQTAPEEHHEHHHGMARRTLVVLLLLLTLLLVCAGVASVSLHNTTDVARPAKASAPTATGEGASPQTRL